MEIVHTASGDEGMGPLPEGGGLPRIEAGALPPGDQSDAKPSDPADPAPKPDLQSLLRELLGPAQDAYPWQLEQRFPHVMSRIEALWGTDQIYRYLDSLTPEDASPSQGFPPEVEAEIRHLQGAYRARYPEPVPAEAEVPQAAPAPPAAAPAEPEDDWDIWRSERRLRNWAERSIF